MFSGVGRSVKYQQKPLGNPRIVLSNQRLYCRLNIGIIWERDFESIAGFYQNIGKIKAEKAGIGPIPAFLFATIPRLSVP